MLKLGIDEQWVRLAIETVCTASYFVLINGEPRQYITPSRGIKQGGPLSPYLIRHAVASQNLHGILSCTNEVCISHLLFADDSFIFCRPTEGECQHLLELLSQHEQALGQAINRQKTTLFFRSKWQYKEWWGQRSWKIVKSIWAFQCWVENQRSTLLKSLGKKSQGE